MEPVRKIQKLDKLIRGGVLQCLFNELLDLLLWDGVQRGRLGCQRSLNFCRFLGRSLLLYGHRQNIAP
jgi:hypothetical protein